MQEGKCHGYAMGHLPLEVRQSVTFVVQDAKLPRSGGTTSLPSPSLYLFPQGPHPHSTSSFKALPARCSLLSATGPFLKKTSEQNCRIRPSARTTNTITSPSLSWGWSEVKWVCTTITLSCHYYRNRWLNLDSTIPLTQRAIWKIKTDIAIHLLWTFIS